MSRLAVLLLSMLLAAPAMAQQPPTIRTSTRPEAGAVIGQRIALYVDVLFAGSMARPPRVVIPEIAGAQVLRFESQATTISDRIDGQDYVGQRFEFALYARRGGRFTIPAPQVALLDRSGGVTGSLSGPLTTVEVAVPPGVDPRQPLIATTRASLREEWQAPASATMKAGDALVRIITREAVDVPAMAMPDLLFAAPPGVRVYRDQPQSEDRQNRGEIVGRRTDKVTYVFEAGGRFALAGVTQPWWNLDERALRSVSVPSREVEVAAAPLPATPIEPWHLLLPMAALAALLMLVPPVRNWFATRHVRWLASEPKAFADLRAACRTGDARAIYRAFLIWRDRVSNRRATPALAEELEAVLFAGAPWTPTNAASFLKCARQLREASAARLAAALPPLNPM